VFDNNFTNKFTSSVNFFLISHMEFSFCNILYGIIIIIVYPLIHNFSTEDEFIVQFRKNQ